MTPSFIGHYRVASTLREGGMDEVCRATGTKFGRDVAIKVVRAAFARNAARIQRFQREAQTLPWLNHRNIAAIRCVEESALVLELVEAEVPCAYRTERR